MSDGIVIVGGGLAAARVVRAYREAGGDAELTILSADSRPALQPAAALEGVPARRARGGRRVRGAREAYVELGVEVRLGTTVTGVDTQAKRVTVADGGEVPMTGSCSRAGRCRGRSAYAGEDLAASTRIARSTTPRPSATPPRPPSRALVIGGGFIGMETAAVAARRGLEVTQVDLGDALYASLQAPALSRSLERLYRERGDHGHPRRQRRGVPRQRRSA